MIHVLVFYVTYFRIDVLFFEFNLPSYVLISPYDVVVRYNDGD